MISLDVYKILTKDLEYLSTAYTSSIKKSFITSAKFC